MSGIENITEKIIRDAKAFEDEQINQANQQANAVTDDYKIRAEKIKAEETERAAKECETILERASSASLLVRRNSVLHAKNEMIDEAFKNAEELFSKLPVEEYVSIMTKILCGVINELASDELKNAEKFGDSDYILDLEYVLYLNERDREKIGVRLLSEAESTLDKVRRKLRLADETVRINGGFIIRYGDVETNCSIEKMIMRLRSRLETKVYNALFDQV